MPAITNPYHADLTIDHGRLSEHVIQMADAGSTAIVTPGSLGEGGALSMDEKAAVWTTCVNAVGDRIPIIAAVSAISTEQSVAIARQAEQCGCQGLMVLPAYAYAGPWSETKAHFATVFEATNLSCMLYNNPIAYRVDVRPNELAELAAEHANLHATKESSGDIRRFREIRERSATDSRSSWESTTWRLKALRPALTAGSQGWSMRFRKSPSASGTSPSRPGPRVSAKNSKGSTSGSFPSCGSMPCRNSSIWSIWCKPSSTWAMNSSAGLVVRSKDPFENMRWP